MSIVINTSNALQTLWVAVGKFSSFALGIISAAILSRFLIKEEYGTYRQIIYVYSMLLVIFSAGLPRVYSYFLPRNSLEEGKSIVYKVTGLLFFIGLFFSLFLFFFSNHIASALSNNELAYGLKFFSPIPALLLPTLGIEGIFSSYKKASYIAFYNFTTRLLSLVFIVGFVIIFGYSYVFALYGWIVASFLSLIIALYLKNKPFKNVKSKKTSLTYKEILSYSLPLVFASLWGIAIKAADQFYISRYYGKEVFAEYSNGFIEIPFVTMITASISVVLMPVLSKIFKDNSDPKKELIPLWRNTISKSAMLIYPMVVFFLFFSEDIMILLYSSKYSASGIYFSISMVLNFFNIIIFAPLFLASGKTKVYAYVHMILAVMVWLSGFVIVNLSDSPYHLAINSVFWNVTKVFIFMYIVSRILKARLIVFFPFKSILKVLLVSLIAAGLSYQFSCFLFKFFNMRIIGISCSLFLYIGIFYLADKIFKLNYRKIIAPLIKIKS